MNKTFRIRGTFGQAWIESLVNDEFNQTRGKLTDGVGSYCCLGVATVVCADINEIKLNPTLRDDEFGKERTFLGNSWAEIPEEMAELMGLTNMENEIINNPLLGPRTASEWNDECGASFTVIAELIKYFGEFY